MFEKINALYVIAATVVTGVGAAIKWWFSHKTGLRKAEADLLDAELARSKHETESSEVMIAALEVLKKKVVEQTLREVRLASESAKKDMLIDRLRHHCPECYTSFMEKFNKNGSHDN